MAFNIRSVLPDGTKGLNLLGVSVADRKVAEHWQGIYTNKYVGKPYPNGKGYYPWTSFVIVETRGVGSTDPKQTK